MTTRAAEKERLVAEMTVAELRELIWQTVAEAITDLVGDPDEGLELSGWVQEQLDQADADRAEGTLNTIPAKQVAEELGLDWPTDV